MLRLPLLMQETDSCFQCFTPFLSFWFRIGQNRVNGMRKREQKNNSLKGFFPFASFSSWYLQLNQLPHNSNRKPSGSHWSCPPQALSLPQRNIVETSRGVILPASGF